MSSSAHLDVVPGKTKNCGFEQAPNSYWTLYLPHTKLDNELIGIHLHLKHLSFRQGVLQASLRKLAQIFKLSLNTLQNKLVALHQLGLIDWQVANNGNSSISSITVHDPVQTLVELHDVLDHRKNQPIESQSARITKKKLVTGSMSEFDTAVTVAKFHTGQYQNLTQPIAKTTTAPYQKSLPKQGLSRAQSVHSGPLKHATNMQTCTDMAAATVPPTAATNESLQLISAKLANLGIAKQNSDVLVSSAIETDTVQKIQLAVELMEIRTATQQVAKPHQYFLKLLNAKGLQADLEQARWEQQRNSKPFTGAQTEPETPLESQPVTPTSELSDSDQAQSQAEENLKNLPEMERQGFIKRFRQTLNQSQIATVRRWPADLQQSWLLEQTAKHFGSELIGIYERSGPVL